MIRPMKHDLLSYRRGCRCIECRSAFSAYQQRYRMEKAKGELHRVSIDRSRQLLLTFESSADASRVTKVSQATCYRIINKQVKKIRRETEAKILLAA